MELFVEPLKRTIHVPGGSNLLEVLRAHQMPVSYSCMSGRCGTCRCRVLEGRLVDGSPETGRPQSGADDYVLACQAVITESCRIELPEIDEVIVHPARTVKATVTGVETLTHDIRRVRVRLAKPVDYSPGQYMNLQFAPELTRPYSMAGLAQDEEQEFHVRRVPGGRVSGYIADELQAGATLKMNGPLGTAYLRKKHTGPMLCVGGGTGLAPVLSVVRGALAAGMSNPIHLYAAVRGPDDLYDEARLRELAVGHPNLHISIVVATGAAPPGCRSGLVTDAIAQDLPALVGWKAYLCGSPAMVEALTLLVRRLGLAPGNIHADAFYASPT